MMKRPTGAYGLRPAMLATLAAIGMAAASLPAASLPAAAEEPLKIGFGMAETGPLAGTGKSVLLAMTIWAEDVNAKGGLLGRQVKLVHYDDQSNPANVPALYAKLIDLDKVDLIISGYATPIIASTIPIAMQHDMVLMGFFGWPTMPSSNTTNISASSRPERSPLWRSCSRSSMRP